MKKVLALFLLIAVLISGCGKEPDKNANEITINQIESGVVIKENEPTEFEDGENPEEYVKVESEVFVIENEFCDLYYPVKWKENVVVNQDEFGSTVKFSAKSGNKEVALFEIIFNMDGEIPLGTISKEDSNIYVAMNDLSGTWPEDLSEYETETFTFMLEDVNVLISKLVYESGMVLES